MRKICVGLMLVAALPLFADLRRGILDETIPGNVQIQSRGDDTVMMIVDSRADGAPDGVPDFVLTVRAETPFGERFAFRIDGASVVIHANRVMTFAPDRKLAVVFEHDAHCPQCDHGKSQVLRFSGFEVRRQDREPRWPRLEPRRADALEDDGKKPRRVVKAQRAPRIATSETHFYYEPVEYWDPCSGADEIEGGFYESSLCAGTGGGSVVCDAGGRGSVSCSVTGCGENTGCSTSCAAGYYACCLCSARSRAHCGCSKS